MSGLGFIAKEPPQQCDDCGAIAELRPYGRGGACVCHGCALTKHDQAEVHARFLHHVFGHPLPEKYARRAALTDQARKDGAP